MTVTEFYTCKKRNLQKNSKTAKWLNELEIASRNKLRIICPSPYKSLCSKAYFTSEAVFFNWSFAIMFFLCVSTVMILRKSLAAISWFVSPSAINLMISISRAVKCFSLSGQIFFFSEKKENKFRDIAGLIYFSLPITLLIAVNNSSLPVSLLINPSAPAFSILLTIDTSHCMLTTIILISGFVAFTCLVVSRPFITGILISIIMQSIC